ncbi:unnamed protein product [Prunus brigantina]
MHLHSKKAQGLIAAVMVICNCQMRRTTELSRFQLPSCSDFASESKVLGMMALSMSSSSLTQHWQHQQPFKALMPSMIKDSKNLSALAIRETIDKRVTFKIKGLISLMHKRKGRKG